MFLDERAVEKLGLAVHPGLKKDIESADGSALIRPWP